MHGPMRVKSMAFSQFKVQPMLWPAENKARSVELRKPIRSNNEKLKQMGIYLSTPKTEKFSKDGENSRLRYDFSSMQGWCSTIEDVHAAIPDLDASTSFFGVYDGLRGNYICLYVSTVLIFCMLLNVNVSYSGWNIYDMYLSTHM